MKIKLIVTLLDILKTIKTRKILSKIIGVVCIILVSAAYFYLALNYKSEVRRQSSVQIKRSDIILRELNEVNTVLREMKENPTNRLLQKADLEVLEGTMASLQKTLLEVAKSSDIQSIANQMINMKEELHFQLIDLKKLISSDLSKNEYLEASVLPFHVLAVDNIAGQAFVSVDYDNHVFPLAVGDLLAGWRVTVTDYELGVAEFMNAKNQYAKVRWQGV